MELVIFERKRYRHAEFPIDSENYNCHVCDKKFDSFQFIEAHYLHNHKQRNIVVVLKFGNHVEIKRQFLGPKSKAPEYLEEAVQYSDIDSDSDFMDVDENDVTDQPWANVLKPQAIPFPNESFKDELELIDKLVAEMMPLPDAEAQELEMIFTNQNKDKYSFDDYEYLIQTLENKSEETEFFKFLVGLGNIPTPSTESTNDTDMDHDEKMDSIVTDLGDGLSESELISESDSEEINFDEIFESNPKSSEIFDDLDFSCKELDKLSPYRETFAKEFLSSKLGEGNCQRYFEDCSTSGLLATDNNISGYVDFFEVKSDSDEYDMLNLLGL